MSRARRLAAVGLAAFFIRAGFVSADSRGPGELDGDARQYHDVAVNLATRGRYEDSAGDRLFRMPGYSLLLAGSYKLFGVSLLPVQMGQAALGALACAALAAVGGLMLGGRWELPVGAAAAGYLGLIEPCARILSESTAASLVCLFLWCWYGLKAGAAVEAGILGGLSGTLCLIRPDFAPFAAGMGVLLPTFRPRAKAWHAALYLAAMGAVFAPWVLRNYAVFNRFIPASTQGEAGIYMGLALPLNRLGDLSEVKFHPHDMPELEQKRHYEEAMSELWRTTPASKIAKAYIFNVGSMFYPFLPQYDWTYMLLVPFWIAGLMCLRVGTPWGPVVLMIGLYVAVHAVAGGPVSRYRTPISGPLILLAAAGANDLQARYGRRCASWAAGWLGANLFVWLFAPQMRQLILAGKTVLFGR